MLTIRRHTAAEKWLHVGSNGCATMVGYLLATSRDGWWCPLVVCPVPLLRA